jgi:SSS family solute:Na+ symporter
MAQNFWIAIVAWTACFVVTVVISWATIPRPEEELAGLGRWSVQDSSENPGGLRQILFWATLALCVCTVLNLIFW